MLPRESTSDTMKIKKILKMRALRTSTNSSTTNGHYTMYEHFGFVSLIFKTSLIPNLDEPEPYRLFQKLRKNNSFKTLVSLTLYKNREKYFAKKINI